MKRFALVFVLVFIFSFMFCGCKQDTKPMGTSSYVDIDQFEDDGENIIPSTPDASVTMPSEWKN